MTAQGVETVMADLRRSLAWMDLVLANLSEGVLVVGDDMSVVFANDAYAKMLGTSRIFLLGAPLSKALPIASDGKQLFPGKKKKGQALVKLTGREECYPLKTEERDLVVEVTAAHIPKLNQVVFVVRDVSERKYNEEMLKTRTEELELMNSAMVGRELKMVELKEQIELLKQKKRE